MHDHDHSADAHLPRQAEPAHRGVAHAHYDREEGVQVPVLLTAEGGNTGAQSLNLHTGQGVELLVLGRVHVDMLR